MATDKFKYQKVVNNYMSSKALSRYVNEALEELKKAEVKIYVDTSSLIEMGDYRIVTQSAEFYTTPPIYNEIVYNMRNGKIPGYVLDGLKINKEKSNKITFFDDGKVNCTDNKAKEWWEKIKEAAENGEKEKHNLDKISNADFSLIYHAVETWRLTGNRVVVLSEDAHIKETIEELSKEYPELNIEVISIRDIVKEYKNQRENNYASASA